MKKTVHIITILLVLLLNFCNVAAEAPLIPEGSILLMDSKTGQILYEKDSQVKGIFPASTTKILTAALALEMGDLDTMMTASKAAIYDIGKDGSNIGIMAGEEMSMQNLLQALLISSANETANIIAENLCSTRQEFVDLMNKKAVELGALDTNFTNPCGAHEAEHYTTAADMARIAQYAMKFDIFRDIVDDINYKLPPTNKHEEWPVLATTNKLMQLDNKHEAFKIIGVKTGYTGPAGHNLVSAAVNQAGMELISVVMNIKNPGSQQNVRKYTKELFEYGFNNFSLVTLKDDSKLFKSVPVIDALDDANLDIITKGKVEYVMPNDTNKWDIKEIVELRENITAPVNKGDLMGYIEILNNGVAVGKVDLVAAHQVEMKPQAKLADDIESFTKSNVLQQILISLAVLIFGFFILRIILRTISRRIRSRRLF